jgi:hypothetical protein
MCGIQSLQKNITGCNAHELYMAKFLTYSFVTYFPSLDEMAIQINDEVFLSHQLTKHMCCHLNDFPEAYH